MLPPSRSCQINLRTSTTPTAIFMNIRSKEIVTQYIFFSKKGINENVNIITPYKEKKIRFPRSIRFIDTLLIISGKGEEEKQNSLYCPPSKYESDVSIAQRELLLLSAYIYKYIFLYTHHGSLFSPLLG